MSTTPHSPPKTPSKQDIALGSEHFTRPQTPHRDAHSKAARNSIEKDEEARVVKSSLGRHIKISSTQQSIDVEDDEEGMNADGDGPEAAKNIDQNKDDQTENDQVENGHVAENQTGDGAQMDVSRELAPMNWETLEAEYEDAIRTAEQKEFALWDEFQATSDVS
jgi:hypothetical protein